jgi:hypothetical protein
MLVKAKTSITLPQLERQLRDQKDLEIIDRNAGRLNREVIDTLDYQQTAVKGRQFLSEMR